MHCSPASGVSVKLCYRVAIALFYVILWTGLSSASFCLHASENKLKDPIAVYLTWQRDPTTTMTVQWITPLSDTIDTIEWKEIHAPDLHPLSIQRHSVIGHHHPMPEGHAFLVHIAEIKGLSPHSEYSFKIGKHKTEYSFRTMPQSLQSPINFVVGGDTYQNAIMRVFSATCRQAARQSPWFAVVGGDIAYACPDNPDQPDDFDRWMGWITTWSKTMITPEGYLIPLIPAVGNHDVKGRYNQSHQAAAFFHSLFAFPGTNGYNVLDFGDYMTFLILDSGHTNAIAGQQLAWLQTTLKQRQHFPHRFAAYHIPAYPSVRSFNNKYSQQIRTHWSPVFEQYRLQLAFEHHDHTYKRTHPIRKEKADEAGVVYIGDGAWGARPRAVKDPSTTWYLAKSRPTRHFIHVIIKKEENRIYAITPNGRILDTFIQPITPQNSPKENKKD